VLWSIEDERKRFYFSAISPDLRTFSIDPDRKDGIFDFILIDDGADEND
jgi:hypothetical protein